MRGFRLNRWQRIGIVLSVLWAVGAWLYMEAAGSKAAEEAFKSSYALCTITWLLVYIIVWTVRWIRRGLQPSI